MHAVFVYGTLKRGFVNHDAAWMTPWFAGPARSVIAYPLVVAGPWYSPVLFDEPGIGSRVSGELYEVDDTGLDRLDEIEGVARPGGYHRIAIEIERDDGERCRAWCYVKRRADVAVIHDGPFASYDDTRYVPRAQRG